MSTIGMSGLSLSCLEVALNSSFLFYTDKFHNKWVFSLFFILWFSNWWVEIYKVSWRQEETFIFDYAPSVCFTLSVSFPCSLRNTSGESPGDSPSHKVIYSSSLIFLWSLTNRLMISKHCTAHCSLLLLYPSFSMYLFFDRLALHWSLLLTSQQVN